MNTSINRSISLIAAFVLLFGNFFNVHALSGQSVVVEQTQQAFIDNFDNLNSALWASGYMWGANDVNMGNANPANLSIVNDANGSSLCLGSPAPDNVGAITSVNQYGYGTYTARMKFTASNGTWPSFWTVNGPTGWEIDGHESLGNEPSVYYMTLHDPKSVGQGVYNNQGSLAGEWHTYSFTWTATDVTFYFDNELKYSQAYSKPELVNVTFTMGIMGNGVIWSGNQYDSTTFANGVPTLCVDYFSYVPLGETSTSTPQATPSAAPSATPSNVPTATPSTAPSKTPTAIVTSVPASKTPTAFVPSATPSATPNLITPTPTAKTQTFTLTLQPNGTAGVDTFINDALNYGSSNYMGVGENNNKSNYYARSLIKFDLSSIPVNAKINSATLSLWTYQDLADNDRLISVYRMKAPFNESQANWTNSATGVKWQSSGASGVNDHEVATIGSSLILVNEALNIEKKVLLDPARLQEMVNGVFINNGFIIIANTELNDRFNYKTSDYSTATQRPKLVIQYTLP